MHRLEGNAAGPRWARPAAAAGWLWVLSFMRQHRLYSSCDSFSLQRCCFLMELGVDTFHPCSWSVLMLAFHRKVVEPDSLGQKGQVKDREMYTRLLTYELGLTALDYITDL